VNIRANVTWRAGDFAKLEAVIVPRIIQAVDQATELVLGVSHQLVPVDTGELASSGGREVQWLGTRVVGSVSYTSGHASFVEFGTGIIGSGTYPYSLPTQGVPFTGSWVYDYKHQNWMGHPAQPYLRPALDLSRGGIIAAFGKGGTSMFSPLFG
jgi:hypothetical protein